MPPSKDCFTRGARLLVWCGMLFFVLIKREKLVEKELGKNEGWLSEKPKRKEFVFGLFRERFREKSERAAAFFPILSMGTPIFRERYGVVPILLSDMVMGKSTSR